MNKMVMLAGIPEFEYWSKVKDILKEVISDELSDVRRQFEDRLIPLKEASEKLGVTDRTMNNLEKRGELVPTRIGTKVMYRESDITQYLNRRAH